MPTKDTGRRALAEGLVDLPAGECPATTREYEGSIARCILAGGHTSLHTDGCIEWGDAFGELDATVLGPPHTETPCFRH